MARLGKAPRKTDGRMGAVDGCGGEAMIPTRRERRPRYVYGEPMFLRNSTVSLDITVESNRRMMAFCYVETSIAHLILSRFR